MWSGHVINAMLKIQFVGHLIDYKIKAIQQLDKSCDLVMWSISTEWENHVI